MVAYSMKNIMKIIQYVCFVAGVITWSCGWCIFGFDFLAWGMLLIFLNNIIFSFLHLKERIIFLVFHGAFFTFLLSRPILGTLCGDDWWNSMSQSEENVRFAVLIVTISLVSMFVGASLFSAYLKRNENNNERVLHSPKKEEYIIALQIVSLLVFVIAAIFFFIQESEKLVFIWQKNYLDYYTGFQSQLPNYIHTFAGFLPYSLCVYLATMPTKKHTFIPLCIYWISSLPSLIVGLRNPLILNSIFIFLYYFLRDAFRDKEKWIGKIEKALLVVAIPVITIFMSLYTYVRSDLPIKFDTPLSAIKEFFVSQGVTFDVIAMGYGYRFNLPVRPGRNYTFGGIIDYILHGRIGQFLFGTEGLPDGNNLTNALESNSLAHNMSYVIKRDDYLNGHGWGSSYLLENYIDFGFIGVVVFSVILGALFLLFTYWLRKNIMLRVLVLMSLTSIFFIPRAEATGWLTFIVTLQFWLCMAICFGGMFSLSKFKNTQKILRRIKRL